MSILKDAFGGIDFTNTGVQLLFIGLIVMALLMNLVIVAIFFSLGLIIPKSKMQDIQVIDKAISRLKKIMFFNKVALCVDVVISIIMAILHFTKTMDIFEPPVVWIALIPITTMPILITAVFGGRSSSENQRYLQLLFCQRDKITSDKLRKMG